MKVVIIGCSGAGKSTLTRRLSALTDYPVLHLDKVFHKYPDEIAKAKLYEITQDFIASHENWIIDGNYSASMDLRLPFADEIVWVQMGRLRAIWRVLKRSVSVRIFGKNRPDMAEEFVEKWDKEYLEFLKFVWTFKAKQFPKIEDKLTEFDVWDKVIILKNKKEIRKYLERKNQN